MQSVWHWQVFNDLSLEYRNYPSHQNEIIEFFYQKYLIDPYESSKVILETAGPCGMLFITIDFPRMTETMNGITPDFNPNFKPNFIRRILVNVDLSDQNLCKGTTLTGKRCGRRGAYNGFCHQHSQNY